MLDGLAQMMKSREESQNRIKYFKELGWKEYDEHGDQICAVVMACDIQFGYAVFRQGSDGLTMVQHFTDPCAAVEFAVDYARSEVGKHEMEQAKR